MHDREFQHGFELVARALRAIEPLVQPAKLQSKEHHARVRRHRLRQVFLGFAPARLEADATTE